MTKEEIDFFARKITYASQATIVKFKDNSELVGFFDTDPENPADKANNFWSFATFNDIKNKVHFNGDDVISIVIENKPIQ